MTYSIAQVAERFGVTVHTLRYYDNEGLLPFVERSPSGIRKFKESDFNWLNIITCLKDSGVPIKQIKEFINWCVEGDTTIEQRLKFMQQHKKNVLKQIEELNRHIETIDYKIWYYQTAYEAGTTAIHEDKELKI